MQKQENTDFSTGLISENNIVMNFICIYQRAQNSVIMLHDC